MSSTENTLATDSAKELRPILGDDATATFEDDPNFVESDPTGNASSENVEEQRSAAASTSPSARDTDDTEEDDEDDDEDEDVDEDEDLDDEDEDDDEDDLDDESDEDDEDDDDEDGEDLDDEDDDDDADEVKASSVLRADGLLGYEDEADDAGKGISREKGDKERARAERGLHDGEKGFDPNSDTDGKWLPVERDNTPEAEGALIENRNDQTNFVPPYRAGSAQMNASTLYAA